jgi:hypothetical protein
MRRWQKILFGIIVLVLLSQLPFAYRRRRLVRLHEAIQQLNAQRNNFPLDPMFSDYREYKGVVHVHSFLGGHSSGNFQEIIDGAKTNQLDFVVMTEHTERDINTAAMTLQGVHGGVLFINGNEVSVENVGRLLLIPGVESQDHARVPLESLTRQARSKGGLSIVAYPAEFRSWNSDAYDGIEIYNLFTNTQAMNKFTMVFDGLWSFRSYPDLLFANFYTRPNENLRLWEQALANGRKLAAVAGVDAHANVGISLHDATGRTILGVQLDPYARSFSVVRVHVLIPSFPQVPSLSSGSVLAALRDGHSFIGFDLLADSSGFRFSGSSGGLSRIQGEELKLESEARLLVNSPLPARVVLLKDGAVVNEQQGKNSAEFIVKEPGVYRTEVYLPQLPHPVREQPWIISNPIYVR